MTSNTPEGKLFTAFDDEFYPNEDRYSSYVTTEVYSSFDKSVEDARKLISGGETYTIYRLEPVAKISLPPEPEVKIEIL